MYQVIEDSKHGYKRLDPLPTIEQVEKYYKEDFYSETNPAFNDSSLDVQQKDKVFFDSRWERIYQVCNEFIGDLTNKKIYDIGFGYAQALIYFKEKGLACSGIEPSEEGVEYANSKGITNGKIGGIEEESSYASEDKQDVVLLINVLEHLRTPFETLVNIRKHLIANNGLIVIDVPNEYNTFQTIANEEYNLKDWWIAPPKHINYFSPSSLESLLNQAGFEVVKREASFPIELFLLFGDVYIGDGKLGSACHKKRVQFEYLMRKHGQEKKLNELYEAFASLELGRQIVMYAKPVLHHD
ncbi:MAG: class I SAM-dependent methyltransferase [Opitutaceae bacterium]|nr:class I SAM-dependent methyltransferase [Cytophagales bacterium]